jgi:hypothetical protein
VAKDREGIMITYPRFLWVAHNYLKPEYKQKENDINVQFSVPTYNAKLLLSFAEILNQANSNAKRIEFTFPIVPECAHIINIMCNALDDWGDVEEMIEVLNYFAKHLQKDLSESDGKLRRHFNDDIPVPRHDNDDAV